MIEDPLQADGLLPCPFCASNNVALCGNWTPFIYCRNCATNGPAVKPPPHIQEIDRALETAAEEAARAWNTRPTLSPPGPRKVRVSDAVAIEMHGIIHRGCVGVEVGRSDGMVEVRFDGDQRVRRIDERFVHRM